MPPQLPPCPTKKNCVCSQDTRPPYSIEAITIPKGKAGKSLKQLVTLCLQNFRGCKVIEQEPKTAHLSFTSSWLRFVDDMHLAVDESAQLVHIRSASRVGYSDFGVNRQRVEKLRRLFNQSL
jgi:uncharacterized protein (DUF1499 family)